MLTVGSLFSGIGGIDLGLERAGMQVVWQVEKDPFCAAVLRRHWPDIPLYGDIRHIDWSEVAPVDLLAGGFPCQPYSEAAYGYGSKRKSGEAHEQHLWPEFERAIRHLKPRWILAENVLGILSQGGLTEALSGLAKLGYDAEWASVPASALGAPHLRRRVFIVGYPAGSMETQRSERAVYEARSGSRSDISRGRRSDKHEVYLEEARQTAGNTKRSVFVRPPERDWAPEPRVDRVAYGLPDWLDRCRALGNSVVPAVAQYIGELIRETDGLCWICSGRARVADVCGPWCLTNGEASMHRLLAVDPGEEHCGLAMFENGAVAWVAETDPNECVEVVRSHLQEGLLNVLVVEDYRLYPDKAQQQGYSQMKTVRLIGVLEYLWKTHGGGCVYTEQNADIKKPTKAMLRRKGVKSVAKANKAGGHCLDAELHGHRYLMKERPDIVNLGSKPKQEAL